LEAVKTIARQYRKQIRAETESIKTGFSRSKHPATGHRYSTQLKICNDDANLCVLLLVD